MALADARNPTHARIIRNKIRRDLRMPTDSYYQSDLAWVHHTGYAQYVEKVGPGIVRLLRDAGLGSGARVLDVGCGSGLLARTLRAEGFAVFGVDASAAMI